MKKELGTYYIGATVADVRVLETIRHAKMRTHTALRMYRGGREPKMKECHMTLVPPFHTTYQEATSINLACARAKFFETHPLITTRFSLGTMSIMTFGGSAILYFHVTFPGGEGERLIFQDYVMAMRNRVESCEDFSFREAIPKNFLPHITILSLQDRKGEYVVETMLRGNHDIQEMLEEYSSITRILSFLIAYPTIYARYANGWKPLSHDPCIVDW